MEPKNFIIVCAGTYKEYQDYLASMPLALQCWHTYVLPNDDCHHIAVLDAEKVVAIGTFWDWAEGKRSNEVYHCTFEGKMKKELKETKFKLPKTPAACADLLYSIRNERLAAQKVVDALQKKETELCDYFINNLPKSDASGIAGKFARVQINGKTVATVKDWPAFYKYIAKNNAFELLQRRVTQSAVDERWEAGEKVPGCEPFHVKTVSVTKL